MHLDLFIFLTASVVNVALTVVVAVKRAKHLKTETHASFVASVALVIAWFAANYLADSRDNAHDALFWTRMTVPPSLLALWFLSWFSFVFPVKTKRYRRKLAALFVITAGIAAASVTPYVFERVEIERGVGVSELELGALYPVMIAVYLLLAAVIISNLWKKNKRLRGLHQMQVKYVMLGWGLFFVGGLTVSLILPYVTGNAAWSKFGPLFSIPMVAAIAYAIVKHRFLDIRLVIQRGVVYTALLSFVVGCYLLAVFVAGHFFQEATRIASIVSGAVTVCAGIFGVPPIDRYLRRATDKLFFKDRYEYSEAVHALSHILNRTIEREQIADKASEAFRQILKVESVSFVFPPGGIPPVLLDFWKDHQEAVDCSLPHPSEAVRRFARRYGAVMIVPIVLEQEVVGALTLGRKRSGDGFTREDLKLLETFAYQAAVAFSKAELYEQVKEYSKTLERKVEERTEEQRQMMIELSHNLQTPLTVVRGEVELLQRQQPDNRNLKTFERSIDRISQFIYDLLKLAKLEYGDAGVPMSRFDLSEFLSELAEEFDVLAHSNRIVLKTNIEPGIAVLGNKEKLGELATNLISNAVKYIANERIISIILKKSGGKAELTVADTGIGIAQEELANLFKRFYRVPTEKEGPSGSGLGLAIAKRIVEMHQGSIGVKSELGKGTAFTVRLPLVAS